MKTPRERIFYKNDHDNNMKKLENGIEFIYDNPDTMFRELYHLAKKKDSDAVYLVKDGYPFWRDKSADACSQVGTKEPVWGTYKNIHPELVKMIRELKENQP